jgi:aryl-alcohol dehydrogenase-like predicted oxidoreductase
MQTRPLGDSGIEVSLVGLGCNNFGRRLDLDGTRAVVETALEAGVTFLDTADTYGNGESEKLLGEVLAGHRDEAVITTKFGHDMGGIYGDLGQRGGRAYVRRAIDGSLERLRTDRVDLYLYHRPDGVTPIGETLAAMSELVDEGKVRAIGCSNVTAEQIDEAEDVARRDGLHRWISVQNEYSLLHRDPERDVIPACERYEISFVPYFPLASGLLTGKYRRGGAHPDGTRIGPGDDRLSEDALDAVEAIAGFAEERGRSILDVAVGALTAQPAVASVIAGAMSPEQVRANADAAGWAPSSDDLAALGSVLAAA